MEFIMYDKKFEKCVCDYEGTEAKLYINNSNLYKIYLGKYFSTMNHLMTLGNMQKDIKNTIFSHGIILDETNGLKGSKIKYFKDYKVLSEIRKESINYKITILKTLLHNLKELMDHYIYPSDLNINGILTFNLDVKIIDLDTNDTKIKSREDKEQLNFVLKLYSKILLLVLFEDYEIMFQKDRLYTFLSNKFIDKDIISLFEKNDFDYNSINECLNYFEKNKTLSHSLHNTKL